MRQNRKILQVLLVVMLILSMMGTSVMAAVPAENANTTSEQSTAESDTSNKLNESLEAQDDILDNASSSDESPGDNIMADEPVVTADGSVQMPTGQEMYITLAENRAFRWNADNDGGHGQEIHLDDSTGSNCHYRLDAVGEGNWYGIKHIRSGGTDRYVDVDGDNNEENRILHLWDSSDYSQHNRQFAFYEAGEDGAGRMMYYIQVRHSGLWVGLENNQTADYNVNVAQVSEANRKAWYVTTEDMSSALGEAGDDMDWATSTSDTVYLTLKENTNFRWNADGSGLQGEQIHLDTMEGVNSMFRLQKATNGYYGIKFINGGLTSDRFVDVDGQSVTENAILHLWSTSDISQANRQFSFFYQGEDEYGKYYKIQNRNSGLWIGIENNSVSRYANVAQVSESNAKVWYVTNDAVPPNIKGCETRLYDDGAQTEATEFTLTPYGHDRRTVNVEFDNEPFDGSQLQLWYLGTSARIQASYDNNSQAYVLKNYYMDGTELDRLVTGNQRDWVWDVADESIDNGAAIHIWNRQDYHMSQFWRFIKTSDSENTYQIYNVNSGLYLSLENTSSYDADGTKLVQSTTPFVWELNFLNKDTELEGQNWMQELPDDMYLSEINLPGTHDAGATHIAGDISGQLAFAKAQQLFVDEQLRQGVRALDIRLAEDNIFSDDPMVIHGEQFIICQNQEGETLRLSEVMADCKDFLDAHPTECIIMMVDDNGYVGTVENCADAIYKYVEDPTYSQYLYTKDDAIPTLGEVRGKIVLMRRYNLDDAQNQDASNYGMDLTDWGDKSYDESPHYYRVGGVDIEDQNSKTVTSYFAYVQDYYKADTEDIKLNIFGDTVDSVQVGNLLNRTYTDGDITHYERAYLINFTTTGDNLDSGRTTNRMILDDSFTRDAGDGDNYFRSHAAEKKPLGIVMTNFADYRLAKEVYQTNFLPYESTDMTPQITEQPQDLVMADGQRAELSVTAMPKNEADVLSYQWQQQIDGQWVDIDNDAARSSVFNAAYSTATGTVDPTLMNALDNTRYRCVITATRDGVSGHGVAYSDSAALYADENERDTVLSIEMGQYEASNADPSDVNDRYYDYITEDTSGGNYVLKEPDGNARLHVRAILTRTYDNSQINDETVSMTLYKDGEVYQEGTANTVEEELIDGMPAYNIKGGAYFTYDNLPIGHYSLEANYNGGNWNASTTTITFEITPVYTIAFDAQGGNAPNTKDVTAYDGVINLDTPSRTGYSFTGWYWDAACTQPVDNNQIDCATLTSDITLYAGWSVETWTVNYETNGGVNNANNPTTYTREDNYTLEDPVRSGYTFEGWYDYGDFSDPLFNQIGHRITRLPDNRVGNGATLYAKWQPATEPNVPDLPQDEEGVYQLSTYNDLVTMSQAVRDYPDLYASASYELTGNIVCDGRPWTLSIGSDAFPFTGTFDGRDYFIYDLTMTQTGVNQGFFGTIGENGVVQNLSLVDCDYSAATGQYVGGMAAINNGTISGCGSGVNLHSSAAIHINGQTVPASSLNSTIQAAGSAGGIAAVNNGTIIDSRSNATVSGMTAGGIVAENNGTIANVYNTGTVSANQIGGGIAGNNNSIITSGYNSHLVTGIQAGGVAGANSGTISNFYYTDAMTAAVANQKDDSLFNVMAMTTSAMRTQTFCNTLNAAIAGQNYRSWTWNQSDNAGYPRIEGSVVVSQTLLQNGFILTGAIHPDALLKITKLTASDADFQSLLAEAGNSRLLGAYRVSLIFADGVEASYNGPLTLSIPVETFWRLKQFDVIQLGSGRINGLTISNNGLCVTVTVDTLGSFGVVEAEPATIPPTLPTTANPSDNNTVAANVYTGIEGSNGTTVAIVLIVLVAGGMIIRIVSRKRKENHYR